MFDRYKESVRNPKSTSSRMLNILPIKILGYRGKIVSPETISQLDEIVLCFIFMLVSSGIAYALFSTGDYTGARIFALVAGVCAFGLFFQILMFLVNRKDKTGPE